jgi:hypothetical protein
MLPEDIDDLFRQKLDGHATPPSDGLWARLQLPADDKEPLDTLFREGLNAHATPPRRELWERLEDEHLRPQPRKRRVAAWWQYSAAAVFLLMLLAGGAGLWRGGYLSPATGNIAATKSAHQSGPSAAHIHADAHKAEMNNINTEEQVIAQAAPATNQPSAVASATDSEKNKKYSSGQATAPAASTSSNPIATTTRPRRPATVPQVAAGHRTLGQLPDAAASQLASNGGRKTPTSQHLGSSQVAPATAVAPATRGDKADAPTLALAPSPAKTDASFDVIEVDVRRGPETSRPVAPAAVAVAEVAPTPTRRSRLRLGGLLRQADRLVHGEGVNLAEATGLPETVTVQARLGGRLVSKTIQL